LGGPGTVTSSFEEGTDGWTVTGDAQSGEAEPNHVSDGGNPGGYLEATDDAAGGVWYWNASAKHLGDKSDYSGGTLSFDLKQSSASGQFDSPDVVLKRGETQLGYDFGDPSEHPRTNWTSYEIEYPLTDGQTLRPRKP